MPARKRCSECGGPLPSPRHTTCSQPCRQKRARRKKAAQQKGGRPPDPAHQQALKANHDALAEVAREELRPVVREAITEDVLEAASKLVGLTPRMVELIARDMESPDPAVSQKAYSLVARFTLGNQSIAPPPAEQAPQPMQVNFLLPRPGDGRAVEEVPAEAVELRHCVECEQDKPETAFVGASDRCQACHDDLQAKVAARFGS